jgi:hypothetical protein
MAAAQPRTAQAARPESKAPDLMGNPVRGWAGWSRSCWRRRGRTRARDRLIRQRPPARAGTGLTDGERRRCRRTRTRPGLRQSCSPTGRTPCGPERPRADGARASDRRSRRSRHKPTRRARNRSPLPDDDPPCPECNSPCGRAAWCSPGRTTTTDGPAGLRGGAHVSGSGGTDQAIRWRSAPHRSCFADIQLRPATRPSPPPTLGLPCAAANGERGTGNGERSRRRICGSSRQPFRPL